MPLDFSFLITELFLRYVLIGYAFIGHFQIGIRPYETSDAVALPNGVIIIWV